MILSTQTSAAAMQARHPINGQQNFNLLGRSAAECLSLSGVLALPVQGYLWLVILTSWSLATPVTPAVTLIALTVLWSEPAREAPTLPGSNEAELPNG
ncbi:hypothetical protein ElyMa_001452200 [Elysia marginata]|uniref:Uncharacterized protein n=1 Tax=Elysia marginata TaxID=1093978 RepID=A0AAV4IZV5_9GAST|nr:hypothetical protein ElyMa_001452200 [Elysia marginata]